MKGIVDAHCHSLNWPTRPSSVKRGELSTLPAFSYHDPVDQSDEYVKAMDRVGISKSVTMGCICRHTPEFVASMVSKHPDRFLGFATWLYPDTGRDAAAQVEHMIKDVGLAGVGEMIFGAFYPIPPHELYRSPELTIIMDKIAELGVPILFHTGFGPINVPLSYVHPFRVDELATAYPEVPIIMGHTGHPVSFFDPDVVDDYFFDACLGVARQHKNVYLEVSYCTPRHVERIVRTVGVEACLFGTDAWAASPVSYFETQLDTVLKANITSDDKDQILGKNISRLLKIPW
jgi:predicted TIM-barrel fold metal-dependent hydrolase